MVVMDATPKSMTDGMSRDISTQPAVIRAEGLTKSYHRGSEVVHAVQDVSFEILRGEFVAITGPSGSGKTTLLQMIGGMDRPTSGRLEVAGQEVSQMSDGDLTNLRRHKIGFVFQHFGLLPTLSVEENVLIPALLSRRDSKNRAQSLLEKVGLAHRRRHRPHQLSGGEMQRVAIARALINQPQVLLADEPTGNLDTATSKTILSLMTDLHADGLTVVVVTHSDLLAEAAERQIRLQDGRVV
jgi:putative ABC transport system ATP-binding protein